MPIINKGIFNTDTVFIRQTGNDWPTAQVTSTADVIEVSGNLYFTNSRANAAIWPSLTTANVVETSGNLYFTTARVNTTVRPFLTAANVANFNSTVNTVVQPFLTAANIANFTSTVNTTVQPFLTAANVANFNSTVNTVVRPSLTTANVIETSANLYFTNARVVSALIAGQNITIEANGRISANVPTGLSVANVNATVQPFLTTANVIEVSSNLYFTNTRARQAINAGTGVIFDSTTGTISIGQNVSTIASVTFKDVFVSNNLVVYGNTTTYGANNLVISDNMLYLNGASTTSNPDVGFAFNYNDGVYHHAGFFRDASDGIFKVFDNYTPEPDANIFIDTNDASFRLANLQATNYIGNVTGFVTGQVSSIANHNTGALAEGTNQYFTNVRVLQVVNPLLTTANVTELNNLYFTNARVNVVVQPLLTTANVVETSGNLYFTNARVVSALIAGDQIIIEANGRISANVTVPTGLSIANVNATVQPFLTTANVTEVSSNLYFTNARVVSALIAGQNITIEANGRISSTTSGTITTAQLTTANVIEVSSNLYYTNARARTAFTAGDPTIEIDWVAGTIKANVSAISNSSGTTDGIIEGFTNKYFTNARAVIAVSPLLTTANVIEISSNLYFTVARVNTVVQPFLTTANVIESASNLYFTYARANSVVWPSLTAANIANFTSTVNATVQPFLTAANIANFNSTVNATVQPSLTAANIANFASTVNTVILPFLTTANVAERTGNLYFTNARVVSALTAGDSIIIEANGRISANVAVPTGGISAAQLTTANVIELSSNLYFTNSRARSAFSAGSGITITTGGKISSTFTTEIFNGLIDGGKDYTVTSSMSGITFTSNTAGDRFLLRSLHVTNISDDTAYISGNVLYATSNTAYLANLIPVPVGSVVEFMNKPQILQPGDKINLQGFNQSLTPTSNILHSYFTYQSINNDITYVGVGQTLATSNTNILVASADQSALVFESIKFVNLQSYSIPVKLYFGSANAAPKSYLAYNMQVPPNTSLEVLQSPKILNFLDTVYASYANASNNSIAIFLSYKITAATSLYTTTTASTPGGTILGSFSTTYPDGTILYYTLE